MAAARRFAEAGTKLVLVARRGERLNALKAELQTQYKVLAQAFCHISWFPYPVQYAANARAIIAQRYSLSYNVGFAAG